MKILDTPRSGSVAGVTSSRNRFGQYYRTRAIPVQPRSPKQTANRANMAIGSSSWRTLNDPQRTAWNDYAAQITRSDRLGSGYSPTGASLFSGAAILQRGGVAIDVPSTLPTYVMAISGMLYTPVSPGPEALKFTISNLSDTNHILVETSGPVSPGLTSAAAIRRWRSLPVTAVNLFPKTYGMTATPVSILTEYKFLFPSPTAGNVIWFRFREAFNDGIADAQIVNRQFSTFRLVIA